MVCRLRLKKGGSGRLRLRLRNPADPYQSLSWIRIRNKFFHFLDPDPYQNDTDPPHCNLYHPLLYWLFSCVTDPDLAGSVIPVFKLLVSGWVWKFKFLSCVVDPDSVGSVNFNSEKF